MSTTRIRGGAGSQACTKSTLKHSEQLQATEYLSHTESWLLDTAIQTNNTPVVPPALPQEVLGISVQNPPDPVAAGNVHALVQVDQGYTAEVTIRYDIPYETVNNFTAATMNAPGPWEGSPFMVEILEWEVDATATAAANDGTLTWVQKTATATDPNPTFRLLPQTSFHDRGAAPAQLTATGQIVLDNLATDTTAAYPRRRSYRLMWALVATDWNQAAPQALGGWTIPAFDAAAQPLPTLLPDAIHTFVAFDIDYR